MKKLDSWPGYSAVRTNRDLLSLSKLIQGICCKFGANLQLAYALIQTIKRAHLFYQMAKSFNNK